jgi:hypothetical protein
MRVVQLCTSQFPASEATRWWDVVCLLAHDERQREFFESMLHCR